MAELSNGTNGNGRKDTLVTMSVTAAMLMGAFNLVRSMNDDGYRRNRDDIDKLEGRLDNDIRDEQQRNNEFGERVSALEKTQSLYMAGKLKLTEEGP